MKTKTPTTTTNASRRLVVTDILQYDPAADLPAVYLLNDTVETVWKTYCKLRRRGSDVAEYNVYLEKLALDALPTTEWCLDDQTGQR